MQFFLLFQRWMPCKHANNSAKWKHFLTQVIFMLQHERNRPIQRYKKKLIQLLSWKSKNNLQRCNKIISESHEWSDCYRIFWNEKKKTWTYNVATWKWKMLDFENILNAVLTRNNRILWNQQIRRGKVVVLKFPWNEFSVFFFDARVFAHLISFSRHRFFRLDVQSSAYV